MGCGGRCRIRTCDFHRVNLPTFVFSTTYNTAGTCHTTRKSCNSAAVVDWASGWENRAVVRNVVMMEYHSIITYMIARRHTSHQNELLRHSPVVVLLNTEDVIPNCRPSPGWRKTN